MRLFTDIQIESLKSLVEQGFNLAKSIKVHLTTLANMKVCPAYGITNMGYLNCGLFQRVLCYLSNI